MCNKSSGNKYFEEKKSEGNSTKVRARCAVGEKLVCQGLSVRYHLGGD